MKKGKKKMKTKTKLFEHMAKKCEAKSIWTEENRGPYDPESTKFWGLSAFLPVENKSTRPLAATSSPWT